MKSVWVNQVTEHFKNKNHIHPFFRAISTYYRRKSMFKLIPHFSFLNITYIKNYSDFITIFMHIFAVFDS